MALSFETDVNPLVSLYLNDEEIRWTKETRVIWLNDGIKRIRYMRGDARYSEWEEVEYEDYVISAPKDLILADIFLNDIVNYIVWKCYAMDSHDEINLQLAQTWEATFRRGINA